MRWENKELPMQPFLVDSMLIECLQHNQVEYSTGWEYVEWKLNLHGLEPIDWL